MFISDVFPNAKSLMFFSALIQVLACVADIICIAQVTLKMVYNALLVHKRGFAFFWLDVRSDVSPFLPNVETAKAFLSTLNDSHPSIKLKMPFNLLF